MRFAAAETAMPHFSEARVTLPHSMAARKIRRVVQSGRFIGLYSAMRSFVQGPPREASLLWREHTSTSLGLLWVNLSHWLMSIRSAHAVDAEFRLRSA